jgi:hypothetical protein
VTEVLALALEVRRLIALVEDLRESHDDTMRRLLDRDDRRTGSVLVPLLANLFGDDDFTAPSIAARVLNDRTALGQAVRELVAEYVTDAAGLRSFGRMLARIESVRFGGYRLRALGNTRAGLRWRVARVSASE